ncbi:MAG: bifunctional phosphoribosyl-AMP cyclohydrolase/phosphoribosyl-ATP diphosphatase HisIE [Chloroflexi bacterium]|nr:bifunctional phosphoribosyl-AMP cyclohydrolase/phosphoribosyl-ATP diphosphatase HisIE [Chloroflexota bacterium]
MTSVGDSVAVVIPAGTGRPALDPTRRALDPETVRFDPSGLVVAIAQDATDGRVLMVAWQDRDAIDASLATGELHFHSRSRGRLWRKGEESGNVLRIRGAAVDCDADTLLWSVDPAGPACHTGAPTCFDTEDGARAPEAGTRPIAPLAGTQGFAWLETLWATIEERARTRPEGSYTARLLAKGADGPGRKVAEEAIEVLMAAKDDSIAERDADPARDQAPLAGEMADLLYHLLVLAAERSLPPERIIEVLRERHAN